MLRLHWSPDSANLVIRTALEAFALPYEAVRVDRAAGEHKGAAYRALNPQGLIPVLQDDGLVLFETGAILLHLADRVGRLGPDGPGMRAEGARAAALKWLFFLSNTLHADLRVVFYTERYAGAAPVAAVRAAMAERVRAHLALIEAALPAHGGLVGPERGIVEIYLGLCLRWAALYPADGEKVVSGLTPWPAIHALAADLERRDYLLRAMRAEGIAGDRPLTKPERPDLPAAGITG